MNSDLTVSASFAAPEPKPVSLRVSNDIVEAGTRVKLTAVVDVCAGHERDVVKFQRKSAGRFKTIASVATSESCVGTFRVRVKQDSTFRAVSPQQDEDHLKGISNRVRVGVR